MSCRLTHFQAVAVAQSLKQTKACHEQTAVCPRQQCLLAVIRLLKACSPGSTLLFLKFIASFNGCSAAKMSSSALCKKLDDCFEPVQAYGFAAARYQLGLSLIAGTLNALNAYFVNNASIAEAISSNSQT